MRNRKVTLEDLDAESADAIMLNAAPQLLTRRYATEAGLEARMGEKHRGVSLETVTRKLEDQEKVIDATGDIDGTLEAFRDTLQRFANGEGQLDSLLQKAGLNATTDELRPVVAYAARALKNAGEEREAFSIQSLPDGRRYVEVDTDQEFFDGLSRTQMAKAARNYILDEWRGRLLGNNVQAYATRTTAKEFAYPANRRMDDAIKEAKLRSAPELENILDACYFAKSEVNTDQNKKHISSFDYYDVIVRAKGVWYTGVVNVAQTNVGPVFYDLSQLKENTGVVRTHGLAEEQDGASNTSAYNDIISADAGSVNGNSYSLKNPEVENATVFADAKKAFGTTYRWEETGYVLPDGSRLDLSGKRYGGRGGYRTEDHRDIVEIYDNYGEYDGNEAMIDFMQRGAIRISPEGGGINLQRMPTKAQIQALDSFISKYRGEVYIEVDDGNGNTIAEKEYPRGTFSRSIIADLPELFESKRNRGVWLRNFMKITA